MGAIITFTISRRVFTALMRVFKSRVLLLSAAVLGAVLTCSVIFVPGVVGVFSLLCISACRSLMFPTIFGPGSRGLGEGTKLGASGLIMAIPGGALLTLLQGKLIDVFGGADEAMPGAATAKSYVVPLVCFVVIAAYALFCKKDSEKELGSGQAWRIKPGDVH
jgi:FHS family L-fucose permease-like MFS transporter